MKDVDGMVIINSLKSVVLYRILLGTYHESRGTLRTHIKRSQRTSKLEGVLRDRFNKLQFVDYDPQIIVVSLSS